jgi:hypothetical protein
MKEDSSMSAIRGKYVNGTVVLEASADWPDGIEVLVEPALEAETFGIRDDEWPKTPEGIASILVRMDQFTAIQITPEEEADIAAWRKKIKEYTIAHANDGIEELFP